MSSPVPSLIPQPLRVTPYDGRFVLGDAISIAAPEPAHEEAVYLAEALSRSIGRPATVGDPGDVVLRLDARDELGDEGYRLSVTPEAIEIRAAARAGLFYGIQTLLQLLPADVYRAAPVEGVDWSVPACEIEDRPRFAWRGLMLDPVRHFIPKDDVLRFIDTLALHKLNRLHFHLTDDQGWRIEIKQYPRLAEHGGWRPETLLGHARVQPHHYDGIPHGGYYTQDDLREIVAYAARRHITVVPEIEMPGHARAWISAYPEVGCFPEQQAGSEPWTRWGISEDVIAPRPAVIEFCKNILREVMDIFPSPWIHTGGDEAPRKHWKESEEMQRLIAAQGLEDEDELQAWFTGQMSEFLAEHGRKLIGWDEILEGGLAPGATVMSWRGEKGGIAAANAGHEVVMTPSPWVYLDNCQGPQDEERIGIGGYVSLAKTYLYDPFPEALEPDKHRYILGLQGNLWSEYMPHPRHVEYMAWPRGAAIAEIDWSPREPRDLGDFLRRLLPHQERLAALGANYRSLARRVVRAGDDGGFTADAATAMLHGNGIRRKDDHLDEWTSAEAFATWVLVADRPATCRVSLTLACAAAAAGSRLAVDVAGQTLELTVPDTGGWDSDQTLDLGTVDLPAGRGLVAVRVLELAGEAVARLRSVALRREG